MPVLYREVYQIGFIAFRVENPADAVTKVCRGIVAVHSMYRYRNWAIAKVTQLEHYDILPNRVNLNQIIFVLIICLYILPYKNLPIFITRIKNILGTSHSIYL